MFQEMNFFADLSAIAHRPRAKRESKYMPKGLARPDVSKVAPNARAVWRRELRVAVKTKKRELRKAAVVKGYVAKYVPWPVRP